MGFMPVFDANLRTLEDCLKLRSGKDLLQSLIPIKYKFQSDYFMKDFYTALFHSCLLYLVAILEMKSRNNPDFG